MASSWRICSIRIWTDAPGIFLKCFRVILSCFFQSENVQIYWILTNFFSLGYVIERYVNILKRRRGKALNSSVCLSFPLGFLKNAKKFPSVEYLETFLEYNQMFVIGSSAQTCNSQTIVYFHDHNISLQARHIEPPKKNIQFNFKFSFWQSIV